MRPIHLALLAAALALPACATIEGAGRDVEAVGEAVSEEARRARQRL